MSKFSVGIDIGGTFTDVMLSDGQGRTFVSKVLNSPPDLAKACLTGVATVLAEAGVAGSAVEHVIHATTLGTNVIIERQRPPVGLLTTEGFRDILWISGTERRDIYDLRWQRWRPPVLRELAHEVRERVAADGSELVPLDEDRVLEIARRLAAQGPSAVAVCFIHSYLNAGHERRAAELLAEHLPGVYIAVSSDVWPEYREYDRTISAVLTAYIGPVFREYLANLERGIVAQGLPPRIHVMQSNGGCAGAAATAQRPLACLESGPAAGVLGAARLAADLGVGQLIALDMGGTTAKASLIEDGVPAIRHDFRVGGGASGDESGVLLRLPVVDLAEVGAGGGSIAWLDGGGMLRVGPKSTGANPGPACYGFGGDQPTVTDANLVLGYLSGDYFLGGTMALDEQRARRALEPIADALGTGVREAAAAVFEIANLNMEEAVHLVTVARGVDPRECVAMGFGGAGPTHIARLAEAFGIHRVLVPRFPGLFSTVGLLESDLVYERSRTVWLDHARVDPRELEQLFDELGADAVAELGQEGFAADEVEVHRSVDIRRRRQGHHVTVPVDRGSLTQASVDVLATRYREAYERLYGVWREGQLLLTTCRVRVTGRRPAAAKVPVAGGGFGGAQKGWRPVYFREASGLVDTNVYERSRLRPGEVVEGPAIIEERESTTVVPPSWTATTDAEGILVLERTRPDPDESASLM